MANLPLQRRPDRCLLGLAVQHQVDPSHPLRETVHRTAAQQPQAVVAVPRQLRLRRLLLILLLLLLPRLVRQLVAPMVVMPPRVVRLVLLPPLVATRSRTRRRSPVRRLRTLPALRRRRRLSTPTLVCRSCTRS